MSLTQKLLCGAILVSLAGVASAAGRADVAERGRSLLAGNAHAIKASADDKFHSRDAFIGPNGYEHARFDRTYRGLPVLGGDVVMVSRGGELKNASHTLRSELKLSTRPTLQPADAIVAAGAKAGFDFVGVPTASLMIHARGDARLAYQVNLKGATAEGHEVDRTFYIDARNGALIDQVNNLHSASAPATFKTLYSGNVSSTTNSIAGGFELRDPSRGNGYTVNGASGKGSGQIYTDSDNTWGNNLNSDKATAAADAQYGVAVTWDYFKNNHGRLGIANNGAGAYNKVHYGRNYVNAYWSDSCFCMTYGDGDGVTYGPLVTLDIAGHEMTHGVTSRTANLTYSGESGGLNEATSDIFGTMVEFYANNAFDLPDYLIGEEIYISNPTNSRAFRFMHNPELEGAGRSKNCWSTTLNSIDVHYSSGPANHFFYLLAEGSAAKTYASNGSISSPTCNASVITGIGRDDAAKIWYLALTGYMTSSTNYAGAKVATVNAATQLFGAASTQRAAVVAAWAAVNVN